jgi:hypothetical protein
LYILGKELFEIAIASDRLQEYSKFSLRHVCMMDIDDVAMTFKATKNLRFVLIYFQLLGPSFLWPGDSIGLACVCFIRTQISDIFDFIAVSMPEVAHVYVWDTRFLHDIVHVLLISDYARKWRGSGPPC